MDENQTHISTANPDAAPVMMRPTEKLRFVKRTFNTEASFHTKNVLQQWWQSPWSGEGKWKDVPLETE